MKPVKPATPGERIRKLEPGQFLTVESIKGGRGSLQARMLASKEVKLYWRYTHDGVKLRDEIGLWDASAPPLSTAPTAKGHSIRAALEVCHARAKVHAETKFDGGWPGQKSKLHAERESAKAQAVRMAEQTLSRLMDAYCTHLEQSGKRSHADARSIFKVHIKTAFPSLADSPAADVTPEELTRAIRKVQEADKGRTANKLRSYLRAAFQCAIAAKSNPKLPETFVAFQVKLNPVADIAIDETANKPDKNPLTLLQMRAYWSALQRVDGVKGHALRLHLLTGGQRIEQFVKLLKSNVLDDRIVLIDPKGKRVHALRHGVALTPAAHKEVRALQALAEAASNMAVVSAEQASPPVSAPPRGRGKPKAEVAADPRPYLISTDGGSTHVSAITLTRWAQAAGSGIPNFQLKQVRSGVETALAGAKISLDLRGLLQSHGLSSLQRRHYDGHDYTPELKTVLLTLGRLLNQEEKSKANSRRANKPKPAT